MFSSTLDLIYVGNEKDMLMIEGSADQMPEDRFIEALAFAHESVQPIIAAIKELVAVAGKPKVSPTLIAAKPETRAIIERVVADRVADAIFGKEKAQRSAMTRGRVQGIIIPRQKGAEAAPAKSAPAAQKAQP